MELCLWSTALLVTMTPLLLWYLVCSTKSTKKRKRNEKTCDEHWNYTKMCEFIQRNALNVPCMIVDEDLLNKNIDHVIRTVSGSKKTVRIATKSVRCVEILKHIEARAAEVGARDVFKGWMCYSVHEAKFLSEHGFDDFFIPYPTLQTDDIRIAMEMTAAGKLIVLTVDSADSVQCLRNTIDAILSEPQNQISEDIKLLVSVDLDMSFHIGKLRLGTHRSRTIETKDLNLSLLFIDANPNMELRGMMGYEAHIAGLPDLHPSATIIMGPILRLLKPLFYTNCKALRAQSLQHCQDHLDFFNGSGSGNFKQALSDPTLTEVTVGSAFLQGHIFDNFSANEFYPAMCFALQVTRINKDYIVCQSGGFIASGDTTSDKTPLPFQNPTELRAFSGEGYGEVQTPLMTSLPDSYQLGHPVFFRPAKSGEIAEHFNEYVIKKGYELSRRVKTYRGMGKTFY